MVRPSTRRLKRPSRRVTGPSTVGQALRASASRSSNSSPTKTSRQSPVSVYVFDAELVDHQGVGCTIAVRGTQTLEHVHRTLRRAFNWYDDHLYSFWLSGVYWDSPETEFTAPIEDEESEARTADAKLESLDLERGKPIAYLFDYGDSGARCWSYERSSRRNPALGIRSCS